MGLLSDALTPLSRQLSSTPGERLRLNPQLLNVSTPSPRVSWLFLAKGCYQIKRDLNSPALAINTALHQPTPARYLEIMTARAKATEVVAGLAVESEAAAKAFLDRNEGLLISQLRVSVRVFGRKGLEELL